MKKKAVFPEKGIWDNWMEREDGKWLERKVNKKANELLSDYKPEMKLRTSPLNRQSPKRRVPIAIAKATDTEAGILLQQLVGLNSSNGWTDCGNRDGADLINKSLKATAGLKLYGRHNYAQKKGDKQIGEGAASKLAKYTHYDFYFTDPRKKAGKDARKQLGISEEIAVEIVDYLVEEIDNTLDQFTALVKKNLVDRGFNVEAERLFGA